MAGAKNHDYHILPPSPWPLIGAFAALAMAAGGIMWMHGGHVGKPNGGGWLFFAGLAGVLFTMFSWWGDVIKEANKGDHTPVVSLHLRYGMILFIASEVMFFVGWFWAFFDFSLFPVPMTVAEGAVTLTAGEPGAIAQWPAKGIEVLNAFELPLLNTFILLLSGTTVTWAHHALIHGQRGGEKTGLWGLLGVGNRDGVLKGLWLTVAARHAVHLHPGVRIRPRAVPFKGLNYGASVLHGDRLPRLPRPDRHDLPDRLPGPRLSRCVHPAPAFRVRSRRLVLAFRRRGVAVPVRLDLRLGRLGRTGSWRVSWVADQRRRVRRAPPPSACRGYVRAAAPRRCSPVTPASPNAARPAGWISPNTMSATVPPRS